MMGHILRDERRRLVEQSAPQIAQLFREDDVDAVLASPG